MLTQNTYLNIQSEWLRNNSNYRELSPGNSVLEITTPFVDRHNDFIQLYMVQQNNQIIIGDDAYTLTDLAMSGIAINNIETNRLINQIAQNFGIKQNERNELYIITEITSLTEDEHKLIQAIIAINNIFEFSILK